MNTADRSIGHIDYAIRRRFAFVRVSPDRRAIEAAYERHVQTNLQARALHYFSLVESLFFEQTAAADRGPSTHLSNDFSPDDVQIGHSYFLADNLQELQMKIRYEVVPILIEYLKDGVLRESARQRIKELETEGI